MRQIKQVILHFITALLFVLLMPVLSFAAEGSLSGAGTETDPYLIKTVSDLNIIGEGIKAGNYYKGNYFRLETDLQLPAAWEPLGVLKEGASNALSGRNIRPFSGIIDGNHHTLTFSKGSRPLFGYVRDAKVYDLNIYGTYIDSYGLVENYVVDYGKDGSSYTSDDPQKTITIDNVTIKSGSRIRQSGFIGGYASGMNHADIKNCTIEPGVIIGCNADGSSAGLSEIGSFGGALNGKITNCVSYATVYGSDNVGGIAGIRGQSTDVFEIENCIFHGTVIAAGKNAGGILGSGYYMYNAPNAFGAVIKNCTVTGSVSGKENVGGILGAEGGIDQAWSNGPGQIIANSFSGKISGEEKVGAIIGYIRALNSNNVISDNTYTADCGADQGFGKVVHVDTDSVSFGMKDGVFYYNTGNYDSYSEDEWNQIYAAVDGGWEDTNRYPKRSLAKKDQNRSDDPLGADLEKLVRCSDTVEPVCYQLDVSGNYKDTYYIGEKLDLSGITLTAHWTQGKADTTVETKDVFAGPFDSTSRGQKTVRLYYGTISTTIKVNVIKDPNQKINVTFSILGDDIHDAEEEKNAHTLSMGTLKTWVAARSYSVSSNATVKDVLESVLVLNHMTCDNPQGNYVRSITKDGITLGEFDNGSMSGWMYTLNGIHPLFAVNEQYLEDGDVIVFHYTDQYYYEQGSNGYDESKKALAVYEKIGAIGTVSYTDTSKSLIDAARSAYNVLSADLKTIVTTKQYNVLVDAEAKYAQLKASDDANRAKANEVINKINLIGTVTYKDACKAKIKAARNAYNALTAVQKAFISQTQYAVLTSAEQKYKQLEAAYIKKNTPAKTTLKSVKKAGSGKMKLTWKKVSFATGYEIYMSTRKNTGYKKIATIKKAKTVSYTKKKLTKKKTYYFKIRTYRKVGKATYYGSFSNIRYLKMK